MRRRHFAVETKLAVVLEGLQGETRIVDICRKYEIAESLYYKWRNRFLEGGRQALERSGTNCDEISKLKKPNRGTSKNYWE